MRDLAALNKWCAETPGLGFMVQDYHRLQLEYFIWRQTCQLTAGSLLEVGAEVRRPYLEHLEYQTLNCKDPATVDWHSEINPSVQSPDIYGDIAALPFGPEKFDCLIATETLEHVTDPWAAVRECYRVLRPGGMALFTTPFMWPYHGGQFYPDYWRFTADGWRLLCKDFGSVRVYPTEFHPESSIAQVAKEENMGAPDDVRMATGYLVKATR